MVDAILTLIIICVAAAVVRPVLMMVRQRAKNTRDARNAGERPRHEWEPRADRLYRRAVGVQRPAEDREAILAFLTSRRGVEAYMEPKTVMNPLSVVLVAGDGEWRRFELGDDSYLRELTHTHGLPVLDAMRTGYPERMRRYRRTQKGEPT